MEVERAQEAVDLTWLLPDDVLADVLRRLPPRSLAVSRCVCSSWRALIDGGGMLRTELLPRSLAGLVFSYDYDEEEYADLFARPSVDPDDYGMPGAPVYGHCNGLLLQYDWVYNPVTDGDATWPGRLAPLDDVRCQRCLVFDPAVSSHYEVFLVPTRTSWGPPIVESAVLRSEWPPSPWTLYVFSSATGLWEDRSFVRQGQAAGTVADMQQLDHVLDEPYTKAEYWRGALYVRCQTHFITRISLSNSSYQVIKNPSGFQDEEFLLGKSEKGIYLALLDRKYRLRVWTLDESSGDHIDWKLRHDSVRGLVLPSLSCNHHGPWFFSSDNYDCSESKDQEGSQDDHEFEWNSDDDSITLPADDTSTVEERYHQFT